MLFSVGHSTLSQPDFLSMLGGKISTVIDVRSHPSSKWPQFWRAELETWLPEAGVGYEWWPALGGWDKRHEHLAPEFDCRGVDLHVYAKGKFPKQRIAINLDKGIDQACPLHGCSSRTGFGIRAGTFSIPTKHKLLLSSSCAYDGSLRHEYDQFGESIHVSPHSKHTCFHSGSKRQLSLPSLAPVSEASFLQLHQVSDYKQLFSLFGKYGTPCESMDQFSCNKTDCDVSFSCTCDKESYARPSWNNTGLRDYSFFMTLPEFLEGCDRLIERGKTEDLGFMCCECLYYKCHRSMISDYLAFRGVETQHLQPRMRQKNNVKFVDGYRLLPHSKVLGNRLERYEPDIIEKWQAWA